MMCPSGMRMPSGFVAIILLTHRYTTSGHPPHRGTTRTHFPELKNKALLSIGMFCDNGCIAIFDNKKVHIINKKTNKHIMHVTRNNQTSLYMVPLKPEQNENMKEVKIPERHFAGSI